MAAQLSADYALKCQCCGLPVGGNLNNWMSNFQAVYTTGSDTANGRLSGPGTALLQPGSSPMAIAPVLKANDSRQPTDNVPACRIHLDRPPYGDDIALTNAWGFLLHHSCLALLEIASAPADLDIRKLFLYLHKCPPTSVHLKYQGHNFGGIYTYAPLPLDDLEDYIWIPTINLGWKPAWQDLLDHDPHSAAYFRGLVDAYRTDRPGGRFTLPPVRPLAPGLDPFPLARRPRAASPRRDPFARLARELRQQIARDLPTGALPRALRASRALRDANAPLPRAFFESRFAAAGEFACLPEALDVPPPRSYPGSAPSVETWRDYCALLLRVRAVERAGGFQAAPLRCRKRTWGLARRLAEKIRAME